MSPSCDSSGSLASSSEFSGIFITEKSDGVGGNVSGDATSVDVQTLRSLFKHVPEICLFH